MNALKTIFITILFSLLITSSGFAQTSLLEINDMSEINIDKYSDAQIISLLNKAKDLQMEDEEVINLMKDKGMSDNQVYKLKSRIEKLRKNKDASNSFKNKEDANESNNEEMQDDIADKVENDKRYYDTSLYKLRMKDNKKELDVFGSEYFQKNSLVFEPNLRISTPSNYVIGPDDQLIINVFGLSEKKYSVQVNEEGEIYIQNVGPINVNGLSIEQATQKVKAKLASTIYNAIKSGQTQVQISLGKIRSIRVTVIGQAKKPGTYTVSSLTTLYNILYLCGGPGTMGSYRNIEVIRGNEVKRKVDLYSFIIYGNQKDNVLLQEGDVIRIPYYGKQVKITGNIKREAKFEMLEKESFQKLLDYCGGFNEKAYKSAVSVNRITDTGKVIIDLSKDKFDSFISESGDEFLVGKNREQFLNRVSLTGSVVRPGNYELTPNLTLLTLLAKAGGFVEDAYTKSASVYRYQNNKVPTMLNVNLDSVITNQADIYLLKDDSISIHSLFDFRDSMYVNVEGNVRKPSTIKWREDMTLRDVIMIAGGITESADSTKIEISSRVRNANISEKDHPEAETRLVSLSANVQLQPYDFIVVKSSSGYVPQRSVMVVGDVKIPGKYILQKSGDKLTDILKRTEGFKASADSSSATIRRIIKSNLSVKEREAMFQRLLNVNNDSIISNKKLRNEIYKSYELISANISQAMKDPSSPDNLVLEDGDIITIEKNTNLVKISGDVYYPTIIPFKEKRNAKFYIKQAGNFMPSARRSGVLVIYPNGKAKSIKTFLFFKSYPTVTSRSEVFVPQKNKNNRTKITASELAVIVSALGVVANVFITAKKL